MQKSKAMLFYLDMADQIDLLSREQRGTLLTAALHYASTGEVMEINDLPVEILFRVIAAQHDRDSARYAETCRRRSENGKKGGRPATRKAKAFLQKQTKAKKADKDSDSEKEKEKKRDRVSDSVSDKEKENERDSVREKEKNTVSVREKEHPSAGMHQEAAAPHTPHSAVFDADDALELAKKLGFSWDRREAEDFIAYNADRGRTDGWDFAVRRWEANRIYPAARQPQQEPGMTKAEIERMNDYLSLVNRFDD